MRNFSKNLISHKESVIEAMKRLNNIPLTLTLFVIDDNKCLIGTLTDGDIRRGLINGLSISSEVTVFMQTKYNYLIGFPDLLELRRIKEIGIKLLPVLETSGMIRKVLDLQKTVAFLPIDVIIMAGGRGERLRPLTDKTPKPMLLLGDKPIIAHNIERLKRFGIENVFISINYLGEQIIDYFGDGSNFDMNIQYVKEESPSGTIGSASLVEGLENPYTLVMNSDLFTDVDIEDLLFNLIQEKAQIAMASIPYTVDIPYAILKRESGKVVGLKEKPSNTHYANAGIYLMERKIIDLIPKGEFFNATDLIEKVIETGGSVIDIPITGYWIDIGQHDEYEKAKTIVKHVQK